jgi:hypothetical protein
VHEQGRAMVQAVSRRPLTRGGPGSIPGQSMWHWDRFFPEYFGFPVSVSFHWCSITRKNEKKTNHVYLSQGCTISFKAAVRP